MADERQSKIIILPSQARQYNTPELKNAMIAQYEAESGKSANVSSDKDGSIIIDLIPRNDPIKERN